MRNCLVVSKWTSDCDCPSSANGKMLETNDFAPCLGVEGAGKNITILPSIAIKDGIFPGKFLFCNYDVLIL